MIHPLAKRRIPMSMFFPYAQPRPPAHQPILVKDKKMGDVILLETQIRNEWSRETKHSGIENEHAKKGASSPTTARQRKQKKE